LGGPQWAGRYYDVETAADVVDALGDFERRYGFGPDVIELKSIDAIPDAWILTDTLGWSVKYNQSSQDGKVWLARLPKTELSSYQRWALERLASGATMRLVGRVYVWCDKYGARDAKKLENISGSAFASMRTLKYIAEVNQYSRIWAITDLGREVLK
jgi:hypothetical protein